VSDGAFGEKLPYGSRTITQGVEGVDLGSSEATREIGYDPRSTPIAVAGGLLLAVAAIHLRRFLRRVPIPG
jgi:hypothetical protein